MPWVAAREGFSKSDAYGDVETDPPGRTLEGDDELTFPDPLGGLRISVRQLFV